MARQRLPSRASRWADAASSARAAYDDIELAKSALETALSELDG